MKSNATALLLTAFYMLWSAGDLSSQFVWLGGGGTLPVSDFGDYADPGWVITVGVGHPVGDNVNFFADGFFGQNNHSDVRGDRTSPHGLLAGMTYSFRRPETDTSIFVFGEVGVLWHLFTSDVVERSTGSGLGFGVGGGYSFPLRDLTGFVEGRIRHARIEDENTSFLSVVAGISVPLGS